MMLDTNKIIVINWFDRETLGTVVDEEISQEEYNEFKKWLDDSIMADEGSEMIREYYGAWQREKVKAQDIRHGRS